MATISRNESKKIVLENPIAFLCHKSTEAELVELVMKTGELIPLHLNPVNVIFYVVQGKGNLTVNTDTYTMKAGDIAQIFPDEQRAWINNSVEDLKLLVIKLLNSSYKCNFLIRQI